MKLPSFSLCLTLLIFLSAPSVNGRSKVSVSPDDALILTDFGAIADDDIDDGPALQAALTALRAQDGGTLYVPAGRFVILTPVNVDFTGESLAIRGVDPIPVDSASIAAGLGLTSEFLIRAGADAIALHLYYGQDLLVQDITFIGDQSVVDDAKVTLHIDTFDRAVIRHCEFYGLASLVPGGATVYADQTNLSIEDSAFLGCAAASGYNTSVVQTVSWKSILVTGTRFVDYGLRSDFFSKTPLSPPYSWISIGNAAPPDSGSIRRDAVLRDVFMDEGALIAVSCRPDAFSPVKTTIHLVSMSNLFINVSNLQASGIYLSGAESVLIEKSHLGWSHLADTAISLNSVGEAILDQVECVDAADTISADASTGRLTVVNSTYQTLDSKAGVTHVVNTDDLDDDPVQSIRQQYIDRVGREPDAAACFYWASRLLACGADSSCIDDRRAALEEYLNDDPLISFVLSGDATDGDGAPITGATVTLTGSVSFATQTDEEGSFSFPALPTGGEYMVTINRKNYDFALSQQGFTTPPSNVSVHFSGARQPHTIFGISGSIGVSGVTVTLTGDASGVFQTSANGVYTFTVEAGGNYTVTPSKPGCLFLPESYSFTDLSEDQIANFAAQPKLVLISASDSDYAIALGSVSFLSGPFTVQSNTNFSSDGRRRIMLFAANLELNPGEDASAVTAEAQDAFGRIYPLDVEYVGDLPDLEHFTQVNVKLSDNLPIGDVWMTIKLHNEVSNRVRIAIVPSQ